MKVDRSGWCRLEIGCQKNERTKKERERTNKGLCQIFTTSIKNYALMPVFRTIINPVINVTDKTK